MNTIQSLNRETFFTRVYITQFHKTDYLIGSEYVDNNQPSKQKSKNRTVYGVLYGCG